MITESVPGYSFLHFIPHSKTYETLSENICEDIYILWSYRNRIILSLQLSMNQMYFVYKLFFMRPLKLSYFQILNLHYFYMNEKIITYYNSISFKSKCLYQMKNKCQLKSLLDELHLLGSWSKQKEDRCLLYKCQEHIVGLNMW